MKKTVNLILVVCIIIATAMIILAGVRTRIPPKEYNFQITSGQRVLIIDAGADTYIRITPSTAKIFDSKVPNGKRWEGILRELD